MARPRGATHLEKIRRQEKVHDLYVKGLHTTEISKQLNFNIRTIQRDLEDVKAAIQKDSEAHRLRTYALADAEYADLWRECQMLLHSPALQGNDDASVKLRIIDVMRQIADSRNNLIFAIPRQRAAVLNSSAESMEEAVAMVINLLPTELRDRALECIKKNVELEKGL